MKAVVSVGGGGFSLAFAFAVIPFVRSPESPAADPPAAPATSTLPGPDTAIAAVIKANDGNVPATGEQLVGALSRLGKFSQLPVPFSSVQLKSGINNPRIVIAPAGKGIGEAELTQINYEGRLYLAANMERGPDGTPRVTSTEFISWNGSRRAYDFGFIGNMGTNEPRLEIVDGGKCFACHKNRGPILGVRPWSNTANDDILRYSTAISLKMAGTKLPDSGPYTVPLKGPGGKPLPDRFGGRTLAMADAPVVDASVRRGAAIAGHRDVYRMLARYPDGRRVLESLLCAIAAPGGLEAEDHDIKRMIDTTLEKSFPKFATDWIEYQKSAKLSTLLDIDPTTLLVASGIRPLPPKFLASQVVGVPGLVGGNLSMWSAPLVGGGVRTVYKSPETSRLESLVAQTHSPAAMKQLAAQRALDDFYTTLVELEKYDNTRAKGKPGMVSRVQPSNPRAFIRPPVKVPLRPSEVLNALDLAETIGVGDGDRRFFAKSIATAASTAQVPAARLTREVFASGAFKDVIEGGPIPDREEFKDRFVEGLDAVMKEHGSKSGFAPDRGTYASGPRYDPKAIEEKEAAIVPTSACLRCHEVAGSRKAAKFDLIPPLTFDPYDKPGRAAWLAAADPRQKKDVLARFVERLAKDADMPPEDSPEHDLFKVKNSADFAEVKQFLTEQYSKAK